MQAHTVLGAQMISGVNFLQEAGVQVVRSHHERWDGCDREHVLHEIRREFLAAA